MADFNTLKKGAQLGMWQAPAGVDPTTAYTLERVFPSADPKQQFEMTKQTIDYIGDLQLRQAKERQKLGEESVKKGLLYSMISKLPEQIAYANSPYGGPIGAAMAYEGFSRIPAIYTETIRSVPQMNIMVPGSSYAPVNYF